jgi:hypothetical protein
MSYQRIGTPRVFTDSINWNLSMGSITSSDFTLGGLSMASGSSLMKMFDLRPSNVQTITANGSSTQCTIQINTNEPTNNRQDANFIAILGHNFQSAGAKINVQIDDNVNFASPWNDNRTAVTDIINADAQTDIDSGASLFFDLDASQTSVAVTNGTYFSAGDYIKIDSETMYITNVATNTLTVDRGVDGTTAVSHSEPRDIYFTGYTEPATNGWSLFTFDTSDTDNNYIRLVIDPKGSGADTFDSDLQIGAIIIGEYWDFPHSPDLSIKKQILYDGITRQKSMGGQTYSTATFTKPSNWVVNPWMLQSGVSTRHRTGRLQYDMNFSYLDDSDLFPYRINNFPDFSEDTYGDDFVSNVVQRTLNGHHPMLIQMDKNVTPSPVDDFMWCRLAKEPTFTQSAYRVWDCDLSLIEEF